MHFRDYDNALAVLNELNNRVSNVEEVSAARSLTQFVRMYVFQLNIRPSFYIITYCQVLLRLGLLHLLKGDQEPAMKHLNRVVELNANNYFAWIGIAEVHQASTLSLSLSLARSLTYALTCPIWYI